MGQRLPSPGHGVAWMLICCFSITYYSVRAEGLEPPCREAPDPKSGMSTNFTTPASARCQTSENGAANIRRTFQPNGEDFRRRFAFTDLLFRVLLGATSAAAGHAPRCISNGAYAALAANCPVFNCAEKAMRSQTGRGITRYQWNRVDGVYIAATLARGALR